jgi:hypothetical protein
VSAGRDAKRRPSVGAVLDGACNIYCKILLSAEDPNLKARRAMVEPTIADNKGRPGGRTR